MLDALLRDIKNIPMVRCAEPGVTDTANHLVSEDFGLVDVTHIGDKQSAQMLLAELLFIQHGFNKARRFCTTGGSPAAPSDNGNDWAKQQESLEVYEI